jgi:hypothetical protein
VFTLSRRYQFLGYGWFLEFWNKLIDYKTQDRLQEHLNVGPRVSVDYVCTICVQGHDSW